MNPRLLERAAKLEINKRKLITGPSAFNFEKACTGHIPALRLLNDESRRIVVLCSRRAAKSTTLCAKMIHVAQKYPNSLIAYFGATAKAVKLLIWEPVWQRMRKEWNVGGEDNETIMSTTFGNGSKVFFVGCDDYRTVETFLGGKFRLVIVDEAQSQPDSVLVPLIGRILPSALSDLQGEYSALIMSGTIPEVEAGLFYEEWRRAKWSRHTWSRFQNPFIESTEALNAEIENSGRSIDDPMIRRDWFGEFVFASELTAFRYDRTKAGYDGNYPAWLDMFSVGIDPGTRDRTAIVVWGWSTKDQNIYQVYEWVTKRNSETSLGDIADQLAIINKRWSPIPWWYIDMGGSNMAVDTFTRDYGLPVIHAAKKTDRFMQVKRLADLVAKGRAKVIIDSQLEMDLQRAQWDKSKLPARHEWSSFWHPDVADAARYAVQGYFDCYAAPAAKEDLKTADARKEEELWRQARQEPAPKPWRNDLDNLRY